ncbi:outer membrane lipoprotein chaperone LolA [Porticoccaceae bacterium LTM1]|nr:outer membrane lipoprotein chaperone LolA [Porticoccaceae bacterium LTM1]
MKVFSKAFISLIAAVSFSAAAINSYGKTDTVSSDETVVAELKQLLSPVSSLRANFKQTQLAVDGFEVRATEGEVELAKPGKMRWVSKPPFEQSIITDGDLLWIYDPDLEQVTVQNFDGRNSPMMLLSGDLSSLTKEYSVARGDNENSFVLTPLDENALFESVVLSFTSKSPSLIEARDGLGELTRIELSHVKLNPDLDDELFQFDPPEGTDVIHND